MSALEASTGLKSAWLCTVIPYSVSVPRTRCGVTLRPRSSQVLAGRDRLDGARLSVALDKGPHVHDAFALLA